MPIFESVYKPRLIPDASISALQHFTMELHDSDVNAQPMADVQNLSEATTATEATESEATENLSEIIAETASEQDSVTIPADNSFESILERLREILLQADSSGIDNDAVARLKQQFYTLHNETLYIDRQNFIEAGNDPAAFIPQPNPSEELLKEVLAQLKDKKAELRAKVEAEQLRNLERKQAIITELQQMADDTDNVNRHYPKAKDLQAEFKQIGEVPQQNATQIWKAFQEAVERFYDQWKVNKELRDYDFKKNLAEKQLLLNEAKSLAGESDVLTAFKRLQNLHDKWREIGPVAKEFREEIWNEFKDASAEVNKRYQAHFEERKKLEKESEIAKTALCERLEAIDIDSINGLSAWNKATKTVMETQEDWKKLGFASRKANNALFARFRAYCDKFFAAKTAYFHTLRDEMAQNLAAKTALCEQAESLKENTDWKETTDKLVELQKEWRKIGAVQKKHSDQIWKRFLAACDYFFDRKKAETSSTRKTQQANLAAKRGILAALTALNAPECETPRDEAIKQIMDLRTQWQQTGHVPFREKDKLADTYRETVRLLFDKYDIHENRARQASFAASLENMSEDKPKLSRERERLMRVFETRRNELKTYENNLGFFNSKTKSGDSMLRDLQIKIERIKNDLAQLEEKISLIDTRL